jgi:hypothetical protein
MVAEVEAYNVVVRQGGGLVEMENLFPENDRDLYLAWGVIFAAFIKPHYVEFEFGLNNSWQYEKLVAMF